MKTVKRPPLKDIRQNRRVPSSKKSKLIRAYHQRKKNANNQNRYNRRKLAGVSKSGGTDYSKLADLQPCIRLTRVDELLNKTAEESASENGVPFEEVLAMTRCLIGSLMIYPNLLGHDDCSCLRKLLQDLGVVCKWDTVELVVPLEPSSNTSLVTVNPPIPKDDIPLLFPAVYIQNMVVDPIEKVARITEYSLMSSMSQALLNLVSSIYKNPATLYEESHAFLYEFLVRFGAKPRTIEKFVEGKPSLNNPNTKPSNGDAKKKKKRSKAAEKS